jgi:hypothetical protein
VEPERQLTPGLRESARAAPRARKCRRAARLAVRLTPRGAHWRSFGLVWLFALCAAACSAGLPSSPTSCSVCDQAARLLLWFPQGQGTGRGPLSGNWEHGAAEELGLASAALPQCAPAARQEKLTE